MSNRCYVNCVNVNSLLEEVVTLMSQMNRNSYTNGMMNKQQLNQISYALNKYCIVVRKPKLGPIPIVVTVLEGVVITLILAATGMNLWGAVAIGASVGAVFAFLCWLAYRLRSGSSKRLSSYIAADGGQGLLMDFASAQPFEEDQFRLGRYYLFIKNGPVFRLDSIADIVTTVGHYRMIPTLVYLTVKVEDENGSLACPLCRVHMLNAETEIAEIRRAVLQRRGW